MNVSYALDHALWGLDPRGYHATQALLHALNAALLLVWLRAVAAARTAALAAALFAVHPALTQGVGYVSGRAEVLCATWCLLALLAHRRGWRAATLALWLLGLASKEIAAALPLALAGEAWLLRGERRLRPLHAGMLAFVALAGAARLALYVQHEGGAAWEALPGHVAAQPLALWRYAALLAVPAGQSIVHGGPTPTIPAALVGAAGLGVAVALAWRRRARAPLVAFGLLWFVAFLAPSMAIPLKERVAEQRLYLAGAGGLLALAAALRALRLPPLALGALVGLLCLLTGARYRVWADPVALWAEAVEREPDHAVAWNNLGQARFAKGELGLAREAFDRALALEPGYVQALVNRAAMRMEQGDLGGARADLDAALRARPDHMAALITRAAVRERQGDPAGALADADAALAGLPWGDARAFTNRGAALLRLGRADEAADSYRRALALAPGFVPARLGLAGAALKRRDLDAALAAAEALCREEPRLLQARTLLARVRFARGERAGAGDALAEAEALAGADGVALHAVAVAWDQAGELERAIALYRRVLQRSPGLAAAHYNLGWALERKGDEAGALVAYGRALRADARHVAAWRDRGTLRCQRGDLAGVSDLDEALRLDPDEPYALFNRGKVRAALHDRPGALADWRRALQACGRRAPELEAELRELLRGS